MKKYLVVILFSFLSILLTACEGSAVEQMSDGDLRAKLSECDYQMNASSVRDAQACHNYRRECARRLKEEGRFVCK